MRISVLSLLVAITLVTLSGCSQTADQKEAKAQEALQSEAFRQTGTPNITNFTERRMVKQIYELRDQQIRTWTYTEDMNGKRHFLCESIGYGIPFSAQYSNPQKRDGSVVMPQAEPNGLFMPSSAEGTWIMAATKDGPKPIYVEPRVIVTPFPLPGVPLEPAR